MRHWTQNKQGKLFWDKENVAKDTGLSGKTLDNYLKIFKLRTEFTWLFPPYPEPKVITEQEIKNVIPKIVTLLPEETVVLNAAFAKILFDNNNQPRPEFQKYFDDPVSPNITTKHTKKAKKDVTREIVQYIAHMPKNSSPWEIQLHILLGFDTLVMGYNYRAYPGLHTHI